MDAPMVRVSADRAPIGANEVLAIGLAAAALLRIRARRKREAAKKEAEERARHADAEQGTAKPEEQS
jgi:hypothetical protein